MRYWFAISCFVTAIGLTNAAPLPLTEKEISLMLRSGYSNQAVLHELSVRRYGDKFDSTAEQELLKAGAKASLLDALRSGFYQLSDSEMAAAKEAAPPKTAADSSPPAVGPVAGLTSAPARSMAPLEQEIGGTVYDHLKDDLVLLHEGVIVPVPNESFADKKLYLLFFSAIWSKEGRQFTPQLSDYYNRVAPQHPEFEIVFFSADRSQFAMENYMTQTKMPWPAVAFEKLRGKAGAIQSALGNQIPRLILADASGKFL